MTGPDDIGTILPRAYIMPPGPCPYLAERTEQRLLLPMSVNPAEASEQLSFFTRLGFRRSQQFLYRPNCAACNACTSYRVRVADFKPSPSQARISRRNKDLWWQREASPNLIGLYALFLRYQQQRHADSEMAKFSYADFMQLMDAPTPSCGLYTLSRATQDYVGAVLVDQVDDGLSAVYSFYDADARVRSLGTTLIMRLVEEARRLNLPYVYLGYWIAGSAKMQYKANFKPAEILTENGWVPFSS